MSRIIIVHISDIHFGSVTNKRYSVGTLKAGLNGHDPLLLDPLRDALVDVQVDFRMDDDEPLNLVVSGDLSCSGLYTDFTQAYTYLHGELLPHASATPVGLDHAAERCWAVPGNHDHWDGRHSWPQPAHNPGLFTDHFRTTPWQARLSSPDGTLSLDIFGVDSNSGVNQGPNASRRNGTARGAFSTAEMIDLENYLNQSILDERNLRADRESLVRAVVCHHALSNYGAPSPPGPPMPLRARLRRKIAAAFVARFPLPLDTAQVNDLLNLCWHYDVRAILTGHTHYFYRERFAHSSDPARAVWELRCGTTLQDPVPGSPPDFLVHEIRTEDGGGPPAWRTTRYTCVTGSFVPEATPSLIN